MTKIMSAALYGLQCSLVEVEVDISPGLGNFIIVGLPDAAVQESRERVRAAIKNSGFSFPRTRVTVNLAPADIKKEGPSYDLPIAVSILQSSGQIETENKLLEDSLLIGELALDGNLRPVAGILPMAIKAKAEGYKRLFISDANASEASLVENIEIYAVTNLTQLVNGLEGIDRLKIFEKQPENEKPFFPSYEIDFAHIRGQLSAKRALEVAAVGSHNILMTGPPGSGKTLLARALPSILPGLTKEEAIEITCIWSVAGASRRAAGLEKSRPFRSPHHSASAASLVGGGSWPRPGEISMAHRGVLFLDEFPEFSRHVLENLRQPLEDGIVTVSRACGSVSFPAKFMLVAAQNPCPCGYLTDPRHSCSCSPNQVINYQKKISGPLLDRIDIGIEVPSVKIEELTGADIYEPSSKIQARVQTARELQAKRFENTNIKSNSEMNGEQIRAFCLMENGTEDLLKTAVAKYHFSARSYHRILKLARSIADLAGTEKIQTTQIAEALQYRPRIE